MVYAWERHLTLSMVGKTEVLATREAGQAPTLAQLEDHGSCPLRRQRRRDAEPGLYNGMNESRARDKSEWDSKHSGASPARFFVGSCSWYASCVKRRGSRREQETDEFLVSSCFVSRIARSGRRWKIQLSSSRYAVCGRRSAMSWPFLMNF